MRNMEWISVKDRLPPLMVTVQLAFPTEDVTIGWLESSPEEDPVYYLCEFGLWTDAVTYWKPLDIHPNKQV